MERRGEIMETRKQFYTTSNEELTTYLEFEELLFKYEVVTGKYLKKIYVS